MGFEYKIRFNDIKWYQEHRLEIENMLLEVPSFTKKETEDEYRFKHSTSQNPWEFDIRIFFEEQCLFVEVSVFNEAFHTDIRKFYELLSKKIAVQMVDDDDELFEFG